MAKELKTPYGRRVRVEEALGFAVYNPHCYDGYACIASEESHVYDSYRDAKQERDSLAKEHDNDSLEVVAICRIQTRG